MRFLHLVFLHLHSNPDDDDGILRHHRRLESAFSCSGAGRRPAESLYMYVAAPCERRWFALAKEGFGMHDEGLVVPQNVKPER